jgi:hypothetical protein
VIISDEFANAIGQWLGWLNIHTESSDAIKRSGYGGGEMAVMRDGSCNSRWPKRKTLR